MSSGGLAEMPVHNTNPGRRIDYDVLKARKRHDKYVQFFERFVLKHLPGPDEPHQEHVLTAVRSWHTVSGPVHGLAASVGCPIAPVGICYSFCAKWSSIAFRWQCQSPVQQSDVGS